MPNAVSTAQVTVEELVDRPRVRQAQTFAPHYIERTRPSGMILAIQGEPLPQGGFVTVYTDVTDRKRAEKLAREETEELEHRVDQRTAELRNAHDELLVAAAKQQEVTRRSRAKRGSSATGNRQPAGRDRLLGWGRSLPVRQQALCRRLRVGQVGNHWPKGARHRRRRDVAEVRGPYRPRARGGRSVTFEHEISASERPDH